MTYSLICVIRKIAPSVRVETSPALRPLRLLFLIECSAQCIVPLETSSRTVFIPATAFGNANGSGGHGSVSPTILMKK